MNKYGSTYNPRPGLKLLSILPVAVAVGLWSGCERQEAAFYASGTFEAVEVDVGSLATGLLLSLPKREGEVVSKDELLATIDSEKLEIERELVSIQLEEVDLELDLIGEKITGNRISLKNNQKSLERFQALLEVKSATEQQLDDLSTAVKLDKNRLDASLKELARPAIRRKELETRLRLLERTIADSRVLSPISGQVTDRFAEPGEVVTVGTPLLRLADLSLLEIRVYLPNALLGKIRLGQQVSMSADGAPDREFTGSVAWVSPVAEFTPKNVQTPEARAELVYAVKIEVPNPGGVLKIGMPADVYFD